MYQYDTVFQALTGLKERGYITNFNLAPDALICHQPPLTLKPSEFEITEVHRFEGNSDPADEAVVYAIESRHGQKGVFVNGYGASADELNFEMVEKLKVRN